MTDDLERHLEKAEKYLSKNKLGDAIEEYQAAYKLAPQNLNLLLNIAEISTRAGKTDEATRYYGELFDKYAEKNDATKAVPLFRKSLQNTPQPAERLAKLGGLLQRSRKNDEAIEAFRNALDLFQKAGNGTGVLDCLDRLGALEPESADTQVRLGEQANKMGKADIAAKAFLRAGQLLRADNADQAMELLQRAHDLAPDRSTALSLAQAHLDRAKHQPAAELLMPVYAESADDAAVLETLGTALLGGQRLAEAEEVLESLYKIKSDSYEKLFDLADHYCKAKQADKGVAVLGRVKEKLFAAKRQSDFLERLDRVCQANDKVAALAEFAALTFNETNQEGRYGKILAKLFEIYAEQQEFKRAADTLEKLIDIDPYDFANQGRLGKLKGKLDEARFRAVAGRITSAATVSGQAAVFDSGEEKEEQIPTGDPRAMAAMLEDMIVQVEIFVQYSLKAKAIEKLKKVHELFPGEESKNERLYKLYEAVQFFPPGFAGPPPPGGAPAAGAPAPAAAPAPAPSTSSADMVSHLAKISEITHILYRQSTAKAALHMAVSELGKYLKASRCLGILGRPGTSPTTAVEFCSPGVPQSPGPAVVKLLGVLGQQTLDPESGTVMDVNMSPELKQVGIQSLLAMPLIDKEKQEQVGVVVLSQADGIRQWKPDEVYLVKAVADQAETAISHTKLRSLMKTLSVADEGTGMLGRSSYLDALTSEVSRAKTQGTPMVLALLELDKGQALLRQVGEASMQKFMQQAGETLLSAIRQNDVAIRYTATALAVVLGDTTKDKVKPVVEKLRKQLAGVPFPDGKTTIVFSVGACEAAVRPDYDPLDIVTDVINRAEFSLEEARKKGNAVVVL